MTVTDWLLDADPAIRWQVMLDLLDAPESDIASERSRVATEGWGAELLAQQRPDGSWSGVAFSQDFDSTMHVLTLLRLLGLDPASPQAVIALAAVRDNVVWPGWGPNGSNNPYFTGEVEPCINGQVAADGAYFGHNVTSLIERLLTEQMADGGWNCEMENGSTRGSFNTTICVLDALLAYEQSSGPLADISAARSRGESYLLDRQLYKRRTTGEPVTIDRKRGNDFTQFAFPNWWHYDVLRGLDYLRAAGVSPDHRIAGALALVRSKQRPDGTWPLDIRYPGAMPIDLAESPGHPSRWITLRALRVLRWATGAQSE